jgi:hypothetical protein
VDNVQAYLNILAVAGIGAPPPAAEPPPPIRKPAPRRPRADSQR